MKEKESLKKTDGYGNKLFMAVDGIYLKLKEEHQLKRIIAFRNGRVVKYVKKTNIFRPNGKRLIGFNFNALKLVREKSKQKYIYIQYGSKYQKIYIQDIFDNGDYLHFLKEGFELQIFYPLEIGIE